MKVLSTWRCSLVGDFSIHTLRDRSVTDGHHGHELLNDSSRRLQEEERALCRYVFYWRTLDSKTETNTYKALYGTVGKECNDSKCTSQVTCLLTLLKEKKSPKKVSKHLLVNIFLFAAVFKCFSVWSARGSSIHHSGLYKTNDCWRKASRTAAHRHLLMHVYVIYASVNEKMPNLYTLGIHH